MGGILGPLKSVLALFRHKAKTQLLQKFVYEHLPGVGQKAGKRGFPGPKIWLMHGVRINTPCTFSTSFNSPIVEGHTLTYCVFKNNAVWRQSRCRHHSSSSLSNLCQSTTMSLAIDARELGLIHHSNSSVK